MNHLVSRSLPLLLVLSACAVDQGRHEAPPPVRDASFWCVPVLSAGKGRIWVYRTAPKGMGVPPDIVIDGRKREALLHGTAYIIDVLPGRHEVMLAYHKKKLEIEVIEGGNYFVRFDVDPSLIGGGFYPTLVDRKSAEVEVHTHTGTDFSCVKQ